MPAATTSATDTAPPLGKFLASSDKATRDKAVESLRAFLASDEQTLAPADMAKLQKGIFYCYWMSDKPLVQQALSSELASIALAIPDPKRALSFLRGFWLMIVREWNGIDRLRMDKYYMLVRKFVNGGFRLLMREEWDGSYVDDWNDMLSGKGGPLDAADSRIPLSLCYHMADIYFEELEKVLEPPCPPPPLIKLLRPFLRVLCLTPSKITYDRLSSALFSPLFLSLAPSATPEEPFPHIMEVIGVEGSTAAVRKELLRTYFEAASRQDTRDANRRKMYAVWRAEMAEQDDS